MLAHQETMARRFPRAPQFDSTVAFLARGYSYISDTCRSLDSDIFEGRLLLQKAIFMMGAEAANLFYDDALFSRQGAMPMRVQKTLVGVGGVQALDGALHRQRKKLFVDLLMAPGRIESLLVKTELQWHLAIRRWQTTGSVVLFPEVQELLCRAICVWAGVPLADGEARSRAEDFGAMIVSGGKIGIEHWRGRAARARCERWIASLIRDVRSGDLVAPPGSALESIAFYYEQGGLLPEQTAAVELINILRPAVAVARFLVFGALALHLHPEYRARIVTDEDTMTLFVQEVRRFYPFFPAIVARVRKDFEWHGYWFPQHCRVLLDLYGTNHDPRIWEKPDVFHPERFRRWNGSAYTFIPQGGGHFETHHRCPGEQLTIALMKQGLRLMAGAMSYRVPPQDLDVDLRHMPTLPQSGLFIENVRSVS